MRLFCGTSYTLLPDYSKTLDGGSWEVYTKLPSGGTKIADIERMGEAAATIYIGTPPQKNAGQWLQDTKGVPLYYAKFPVGIENTDVFLKLLSDITGCTIPDVLHEERGRLIDAYIDGHKYVNGRRSVIYGEEDFINALASFLGEIGITPVIAASSAKNADFAGITETALNLAEDSKPDIVIGNSKGLYIARTLSVPLLRCGFPVHDRMGAQRILHLGYRGALSLFDSICNCLIEVKQGSHKTGWTYI